MQNIENVNTFFILLYNLLWGHCEFYVVGWGGIGANISPCLHVNPALGNEICPRKMEREDTRECEKQRTVSTSFHVVETR